MRLRDAVAWAESLGVEVRQVRRHGELDFVVRGRRPCRVNQRRESAPKHLECWLRKIERERGKPA